MARNFKRVNKGKNYKRKCKSGKIYFAKKVLVNTSIGFKKLFG